ncbi:MAG: CBS domain-containing protein [Deltaproteobacteria bacterium]|nr:CBS domain-containing protein [Deltaproteobacteria bacterium]
MALRIGQLITNDSRPIAIHMDDPVLHAVRVMNDEAVGSVLVLGPNDDLVGIFTERDVLTRVIEGRCSAHDTSVAEVMTPTPLTVDHQTPLDEAHSLMRLHGVAHLPVVKDGEVIGVVALRDVRSAMALALTYENRALRGYIHGPVARASESFF